MSPDFWIGVVVGTLLHTILAATAKFVRAPRKLGITIHTERKQMWTKKGDL